jgi:hypothetical protein
MSRPKRPVSRRNIKGLRRPGRRFGGLGVEVDDALEIAEKIEV